MANAKTPKTNVDRMAATAVRNGHVASSLAEVNTRKHVGSTRQLFAEAAKSGTEAAINGIPVFLEHKDFSTHSFGFYANGKMVLPGKEGVRKGDWEKSGPTIEVTMPTGQVLTILPKKMSTGSIGWYVGDKYTFKVGGEDVRFQSCGNFTIVKSKDMSDNELVGSRVQVQIGWSLVVVDSKLLPLDK